MIKTWCEFYSEDLLPQTRAMVKKTAPKLDAFGLFLPSRMGPTLSQDLLQKGLKLGENAASEGEESETLEKKDPSTEDDKESDNAEEAEAPQNAGEDDEVEEVDEEEVIEEEDYYDEEYYDDEDEL